MLTFFALLYMGLKLRRLYYIHKRNSPPDDGLFLF